jgi:hypothetical protein
MRSRAFGWVVSFIVAGFAFAAAPASAQAQGLCNYDQYGRAYNCHHTGLIVPAYQPSCYSCGNRGLFTSGWVAPCGTCQQMYAPVQPCGSCQQVYAPQVYAPQVYGPQVYGPEVYGPYGPQVGYPAPGYVQSVVDDDDDDDVRPVYRERGPRRGYVHGPWRTRTAYRGTVRHRTTTVRHRERRPGGGY